MWYDIVVSSILISSTVGQMTSVFWRRSIDVINEEITAVSHLDVDGPLTTG